MSDTTVEKWHGTSGGYTNHKCRCNDCREAWRVQHFAYIQRSPIQRERHANYSANRYWTPERLAVHRERSDRHIAQAAEILHRLEERVALADQALVDLVLKRQAFDLRFPPEQDAA